LANHKSAVKRSRQSLVRRARNNATKSAVKSAEKRLRTALANKEVDTAQKLLIAFTSRIGKAAQKGVFHAKTAARKISRLALETSKLNK
jgi:small subunit ribosomal protein S20